MHEEVRSNLHTRLSRSLRLSSIAGSGLPERMRTTAFAFLGLTAALGLALVALFAQLSFPVLSPAPAPGGPLEGNGVAEAVALDHPPAALARAGGRRAVAEAAVEAEAGDPAGGGTPATGADVVAPVPAPEPPNEAGEGSAPDPPGPTPDPAPAPHRSPSEAGAPGSGSPPKPQPTPARPAEPEPAPTGPGNSQSTVAAEHASERGAEASARSSAVVPAPEAAAGDSPGNGSAFGQDK